MVENSRSDLEGHQFQFCREWAWRVGLMGEMVSYTWDWQREYEEIREELTRRWQYRMGGRPYPTELTNAAEIIQTLERMVPPLQRRINEELKEQALSAMQQIAKQHKEQLTEPTKRTGTGHGIDDMPRTPSELQLEQVRIMQGWARRDAERQAEARFTLRMRKYCETDCPYPDVCGESKYRGDCVLKRLSYVTDAPGWRKLLLGQKFIPLYPFDSPQNYALQQIRRSRYYTPQDEERLKRIHKYGCRYEPELCRHWAMELLGRVENRCRVCKKSAYELTGCGPGEPGY